MKTALGTRPYPNTINDMPRPEKDYPSLYLTVPNDSSLLAALRNKGVARITYELITVSKQGDGMASLTLQVKDIEPTQEAVDANDPYLDLEADEAVDNFRASLKKGKK